MAEYPPTDDTAAPIQRVLRDSWHTARKAHRCAYCREDILPGDRYRRIVLISDGELSTIAMHHMTMKNPETGIAECDPTATPKEEKA